MKRYFLLGGNACILYDEGNLEDIGGEVHDTLVYDDSYDIVDVISLIVGWQDFREITESEYYIIKG